MFSRDKPGFEDAPAPEGEGGVVLEDGREWSVSTCVERVTGALAPLASPPARDVVLLAGDFRDAHSRLLLTWATLSGAALLLEPDARLGPAAARWARPTLLWETAAELARWQREAAPSGRWQRRRGCPFQPPLDRLRGVVVLGPDPLPEVAENFWRRAGVTVLRLV
jgi:hypothetical protein